MDSVVVENCSEQSIVHIALDLDTGPQRQLGRPVQTNKRDRPGRDR